VIDFKIATTFKLKPIHIVNAKIPNYRISSLNFCLNYSKLNLIALERRKSQFRYIHSYISGLNVIQPTAKITINAIIMKFMYNIKIKNFSLFVMVPRFFLIIFRFIFFEN